MVWLGVGLLDAADYLLRVSGGDIKTGGVPDVLGGMLLILLGAVSLWLLYQAVRHIRLWKRLALVAGQAVVGYVLAAVIGIYYVCVTGIDCF